jgi:hypothetical protein
MNKIIGGIVVQVDPITQSGPDVMNVVVRNFQPSPIGRKSVGRAHIISDQARVIHFVVPNEGSGRMIMPNTITTAIEKGVVLEDMA